MRTMQFRQASNSQEQEVVLSWKVACTILEPVERDRNYIAWTIHQNLGLATVPVGAPAPKVIRHQKAIMLGAAVVSVCTLKAIHWRWNHEPYSYQLTVDRFTFIATPEEYVVRKFCN
jgi:hypothetical protein